MSRTQFWVRPLDTLFIGPPHSAPAGEDTSLYSEFPPSISSFQGLVRTRLLTGAEPPLDLSPRNQPALDALIGTPSALPTGWQLEGPFPASRPEEYAGASQLWFPLPRTVYLDQDGETPALAEVLDDFGLYDGLYPDGLYPDAAATAASRQPSLNDLNAGQPAPLMLLGRPSPKKAKSGPLLGWCSEENLWRILSGEVRSDGTNRLLDWDWEGYGKTLPPFVKYEPRAGLEIDPQTGTARDQMLFFIRSLRFAEGSGLVGWLDAILPKPLRAESLIDGVGRMGKATRALAFEPSRPSSTLERLLKGEHLTDETLKQCCVERPVPAAESDASVEPITCLLWLVLLSPVLLEDPNRPALRLPFFANITATVRGALIGDALRVGGYLGNAGTVQPNRLYTPAGSAWLLELHGQPADVLKVARALHGGHPLGPLTDTAFGYGLTMIGLAPNLWRTR